jgi:hypothetical protein
MQRKEGFNITLNMVVQFKVLVGAGGGGVINDCK